MATLCSIARQRDSLRCPARAVGREDQLRADAAVARQGLRAAGGAWARAQVPGKASPSAGRWYAILESARSHAWALTKIGGQPPFSFRAFLNTARQHRLFAFYRLAAYTGARRGELLNLRWRNIDLDLGEVCITGSTAVIADQCIEGTTKAAGPAPSASNRTQCKCSEITQAPS
jgi:integrase